MAPMDAFDTTVDDSTDPASTDATQPATDPASQPATDPSTQPTNQPDQPQNFPDTPDTTPFDLPADTTPQPVGPLLQLEYSGRALNDDAPPGYRQGGWPGLQAKPGGWPALGWHGLAQFARPCCGERAGRR